MPITSLRISDFRNLATVQVSPSIRGLNIIAGENGSGKTSLLEAIYYLGLGRSFRSSTAARLIRYSVDKLSIYGQLLSEEERFIPVGIERTVEGVTKMRMAERDVSSIAEIAPFLPIRLINSQSHHLFESGPAYRRKYLDWGLFYQSEHFLPTWRHFERALKQRNVLLQERRRTPALDTWTHELVKHGLALDQMRRDYVAELIPVIKALSTDLLTIADLEIEYHRGWHESLTYAEALANAYTEECRFGHTQNGPHRANLEVKIRGVNAKHFLSRGQQKLLICAMMIAQGIVLARHANKSLIYLVDDLPSELDLHSKQKLLSLLAKQQTQIFITAIDTQAVGDFMGNHLDIAMKVFHVEHGSIVERS